MILGQQVRRARLRTWARHLVLVLNLSIGLSYVGLWLMQAQRGLFWRADFSAFYTGWAIVRDGRGAQLYDLDVQTRYQQQILEGHSFKDGLLPYVNPPYATIPFAPLAWLPRATAFWLWSLGQVALLLWLLRLLGQISVEWRSGERLLMYSAVVAFPPMLVTFALGAFSLFMLICLLQLYQALKDGREARAGAWLVLGTIKFQIMMLPAVLLARTRRWRALLSALALGSALVVISGVWLGWEAWTGFVKLLQAINGFFGIYGIVPAKMYNFRGTLALLLGDSQGALINTLGVVALGGATAVTLWLWRGPWRPDQPSFELRMALTILLGLLFSPHLYPHDGLMLVAPALLFYIYLRRRNLERTRYAALMLSCPLLFHVGESTVGGSLGVRVPVVVMVALLIWMAKALGGELGAQRTETLLPVSGGRAEPLANRDRSDIDIQQSREIG